MMDFIQWACEEERRFVAACTDLEELRDRMASYRESLWTAQRRGVEELGPIQELLEVVEDRIVALKSARLRGARRSEQEEWPDHDSFERAASIGPGREDALALSRVGVRSRELGAALEASSGAVEVREPRSSSAAGPTPTAGPRVLASGARRPERNTPEQARRGSPPMKQAAPARPTPQPSTARPRSVAAGQEGIALAIENWLRSTSRQSSQTHKPRGDALAGVPAGAARRAPPAERPRPAVPALRPATRSSEQSQTLFTGLDLAQHRAAAGLTQRAAAEQLGVSHGTVAKAELAPEKVLGEALQAAMRRVV